MSGWAIAAFAWFFFVAIVLPLCLLVGPYVKISGFQTFELGDDDSNLCDAA